MRERDGVLIREQLAELLASEPPLARDLPAPAEQLQPHGIDLTVAAVARYVGQGQLAVSDAGRRLPEFVSLEPDAEGWWELAPGPYLLRFSETVSLPADCMAYARPRSSLLRCGVALHTAVWDAGYSGQGVALLVVYNPAGFRLQRSARVAQLVLHRLERPVAEGYRGAYQGERG
ncbi:MAG: deoxyuridine 5'-triphosphate nucleotidohydrolase [Thermomicrobium sp.]|nr:deoxyuridine 5'-triphosphate nucleotidohydrolase [Thermomicrobium sp.]MDW8060586.1 deoxyuridine 5'-triphosphate nucleotidohydrolase [Thermomicrobium sp.]